jgi:hypothetical protein
MVQTAFFSWEKGLRPIDLPEPFWMPVNFPQITEIPIT